MRCTCWVVMGNGQCPWVVVCNRYHDMQRCCVTFDEKLRWAGYSIGFLTGKEHAGAARVLRFVRDSGSQAVTGKASSDIPPLHSVMHAVCLRQT